MILTQQDAINLRTFLNYGHKIYSNYDWFTYNGIYKNVIAGNMIETRDFEKLLNGGKIIKNNDKDAYQKFMFALSLEHYDLEILTDLHIFMMSANKYFFLVLKFIEPTLSEKHFIAAIINSNVDLIEYMIEKHNYNYETKHLEMACKFADIDMIYSILQNKIIPTQKSFDLLVSRFDFTKQEVDKNGFCLGQNIDDIPEIKLLLDYGFCIKQPDFIFLLKRGIYIKNYQKYKLVIDDDVKKICNEILCFHYPEIKFEKSSLINMFKNNCSMAQIKTVIKKHNFTANLDCLREACSHKNLNHRLIYYLIDDQKITPDIQCLLLVIKNAGDNIKIIRHIYDNLLCANKNENNIVINNDDVEYNVLKKYLIGNITESNYGDSDIENEEENEEINEVV